MANVIYHGNVNTGGANPTNSIVSNTAVRNPTSSHTISLEPVQQQTPQEIINQGNIETENYLSGNAILNQNSGSIQDFYKKLVNLQLQQQNKANAFSEYMTDKANAWSANEAEKNRLWQEQQSNTAHQREVADLIKAGLNPALSATLGGANTGSGAVGQAFSEAGKMTNIDISSILNYMTQITTTAMEVQGQKEIADKQMATQIANNINTNTTNERMNNEDNKTSKENNESNNQKNIFWHFGKIIKDGIQKKQDQDYINKKRVYDFWHEMG